MNYRKKIIEFSEGLLSKEEEQSLLSEMTVNDELRNQFKSVMAFEKDIRNSAGNIKPSNKMRAGVFAAAGFSDMSGSAVAASAGAAKNASFFSKFLPIIATALLSSILTGFVFSNYFKNTEEFTNNSIAGNYVTESLPELSKPVFEIDYSENKQMPLIQNRTIPEKNMKMSTQDSDFQNKKDIKYISESLAYSDIVENIDVRSNGKPFVQESNINADNEYRILEITDFSEKLHNILGNVSVEFSGIDNLFFDEQNVFSANLKPFINKNIGINYNINDYLFAGFSFRGENYYLTYNSIDEDNTRYIYEQQPILYSYNLYVGAETEIYRFFNPFVKLTAGATKIGPVARAETGLGINITKNIQLFGGIGYDAIFFRHQQNEFDSRKWNVNYGIKYIF